jgi:hypothetical protein
MAATSQFLPSNRQLTTRTCYTLDGVAVALRVTGDPEASNNGLYYLHGDHLGSLSLMTDSGGALVADSIARFLPFGAYRSDGSQPVDGNDLSDRGFTGHYENRYIKLIDMRARGYVTRQSAEACWRTPRFSVSWGTCIG